MDTSALTPAQQTEFLAAKALLEAQVDVTYYDPAANDEARARFTDFMVDIGKWNPPTPQPLWETALDKIMWFFSELLYFTYGPRGFADFPWAIWR